MSDAQGITAPITAVTVFRDGARVVRAGQVTLDVGERQVLIGGLPASADPASVRVAVRGRDAALLDVEVRRRYVADPLRDEAVRLRSDVEVRRDEVQALDDADAAEQAALGFAGHLAAAAATAMARAVSFGRAGHDDLDQMATHLSAATAGALERRRDISARRRVAHREMQAAEHRLAAVEKRAPEQFIEVLATIEVTAATQGQSEARAELELSYHTADVFWRPLYDLGLTGEKVTVSYLAEITQRTGEDWPAVDLSVSTTRRGLHQTLPDLRPWYVGRVRVLPHPPMAAPQVLRSAAAAEITAGAYAGPPPAGMAEPMQAQVLTAEVGDSGAGLVYRIPRPLAIPSDGSPHKTMIARFELDAVLDHLAVPVLAPEAYLRATVTNSGKLLLLPGPARIFHDGQFVGETELETVAAGEEFELQLGVDDQIRVERELRRRSTSKAVIGGSRTIDIGYEITVQNHRPGQARISVHDHIPLSSDGEIKVRLRETSPAPAEQSDLGELTWDLKLEAGQQATIKHRFTIEHPAQVTLTGL